MKNIFKINVIREGIVVESYYEDDDYERIETDDKNVIEVLGYNPNIPYRSKEERLAFYKKILNLAKATYDFDIIGYVIDNVNPSCKYEEDVKVWNISKGIVSIGKTIEIQLPEFWELYCKVENTEPISNLRLDMGGDVIMTKFGHNTNKKISFLNDLVGSCEDEDNLKIGDLTFSVRVDNVSKKRIAFYIGESEFKKAYSKFLELGMTMGKCSKEWYCIYNGEFTFNPNKKGGEK